MHTHTTKQKATTMQHLPKYNHELEINHKPILEWFSRNHRTPEGRAMYNAMYAVFVRISQRLGGGLEPFLYTKQADTAKTDLNTSTVYEQVIRYLMAANRSGLINLCPHSTPECRAGCLGHTSGRLQFKGQQLAQYIRTVLYVENPLAFHIIEIDEIARHARRVNRKGFELVSRPNGTSDNEYETMPWLLDCWERVGLAVAYDYTANHARKRGWQDVGSMLPYHVTHSTKERNHPNSVKPGSYTVVAIKKGVPVPATYNGYPVEDGDKGDMRFLDRPGHVTLGRAKGALKKVEGKADGFVKPASHKHNARRLALVSA